MINTIIVFIILIIILLIINIILRMYKRNFIKGYDKFLNKIKFDDIYINKVVAKDNKNYTIVDIMYNCDKINVILHADNPTLGNSIIEYNKFKQEYIWK